MRVQERVVLAFAVCAVLVSAGCQSTLAQGLLTNPGFDSGTVPQHAASGPWTQTLGGWTYECPGSEDMIVYNENCGYYGDAAYHPVGAVDAVRTRKVANTGNPGDVYIYQDVAVSADTEYAATAWARARGTFGDYEGDMAELIVEEYDSVDGLLLSHTASISAANAAYEQLSLSFTSGSTTAKLRFILHTRVTGAYYEGDVSWDDCGLYAVVPPATVTGVVLAEGLPLADATVTCEGQSTKTNSSGVYTLSGIQVTGAESTITATKVGYSGATATVTLASGTNAVNLRMTQTRFANYLVNGGFASGTVLQYDGAVPMTVELSGWTYEIPGSEPMVIYNENCGYYANAEYHPAGAVDAVRTRKLSYPGNPGDIYISQTMDVPANREFMAYAWARARSVFGTYDGDLAELVVEEYDSSDNLVDAHTDSIDTANTAYELLSTSFTTTGATTKMRFRLHTRLTEVYYDGDVTWDDCGLVSPAPYATITGTVTSSGAPVAGATVSCQDLSTTSGSDGVYTLTDVLVPDAAAEVEAVKAGYATTSGFATLVSGVNTVNIEMARSPSGNLLVNGDFASGAPSILGQCCGYEETVEGWTYSFPSEVAFAAPSSASWTWYHPTGEADAVLFYANEGDYPGVVEAYQFVDVSPSTDYSGYIWIIPIDHNGYGFGRNPGDMVELVIEEYDSGDGLLDSHVVDHTEPMFEAVYIPLATSFTTTATTAKVKFKVRTTVTCSFSNGSVSLDDCYFGAGADVVATVTGVVSSDGSPVADAEVNVLGRTAVTDGNGVYTISNAVGDGLVYTMAVSRNGYYPASRQVTLLGGTNVVDFDLVSAGSNNLLVNGGFEVAPPLLNPFGNGQEATSGGWTYYAPGETMIIANESLGVYASADFYPEGALDALRVRKTDATGNPGDAFVYQDVTVSPNTDYTASVMVRARGAFGAGSTDLAAVDVEEYSGGGALLDTHSVEITQANESFELAILSFHTNANTGKVRFKLHTTLTCGYATGDVTYDDCALVQGIPATITGSVTNGGSPVSGATVTLDGKWTATTDPSGAYTIANVPPIARATSLIASASGFYDNSPAFVPTGGTNRVDLPLTPLPSVNLLMNGGFERGVPPIGAQGFGYTRVFSGWNYNIPGESMELNPESGSASTTRKYHPNDEWEGWNAVRVDKAVFTGNTGDVVITQDVSVLPSSPYRATAYALARNYRGMGFGSDTRDSVRIVVEEYDRSGALKETHTSNAITKPTKGMYQPIETSFTTTATTAKLLVKIQAVMSSSRTGDVSIDDCILNGPSVPLSTLKSMADGSGVSVAGETVSAVYDGFFYIEAADRSNGIRVTGGDVAVGDLVNVDGTIATLDGERTIVSDFAGTIGTGAQPRPLGLNNRATGIEAGLSAVGLYVNAWGRVSSVDAGTFSLTDGSANELKVYGAATLGDFVVVTGALGSETYGSSTIPVLRAVSVTKVAE